MVTTNCLRRRIERLEAAAPVEDCRTCSSQPTFTLDTENTGENTGPCSECGRPKLTFSIAIDRLDTLPGDSA